MLVTHALQKPQPPELARPATSGDIAFSIIFFGGVNVALLAWAWRRGRRYQGLWSMLWYLVVLPLVFVSTRIGIETARDPTSHNLWPFEFVMFGLPTWIVVWILGLIERSRTARDGARPSP